MPNRPTECSLIKTWAGFLSNNYVTFYQTGYLLQPLSQLVNLNMAVDTMVAINASPGCVSAFTQSIYRVLIAKHGIHALLRLEWRTKFLKQLATSRPRKSWSLVSLEKTSRQPISSRLNWRWCSPFLIVIGLAYVGISVSNTTLSLREAMLRLLGIIGWDFAILKRIYSPVALTIPSLYQAMSSRSQASGHLDYGQHIHLCRVCR